MAKMAPSLLTQAKEAVDNIFVKLSNLTNIDMTSVRGEFINFIEKFASSITTGLPEKLVSIVQGFVSGVGNLLVGFVIGFYLLYLQNLM